MKDKNLYVKTFVTPEMARKWLADHNDHNRPIRANHVSRLADHMRKGLWQYSPQTISFATNGSLIDGQHRLSAVVESGIGCHFLVCHGFDPVVFDVVDVDLGGRNASDLLSLKIRGVKNPNKIVAVARAMLEGCTQDPTITALEVRDFAEAHLDLIASFMQALHGSMANLTTRAAIVAAFCNAVRQTGAGPCGARDYAHVMALAQRFASQQWNHANDPMKALFNRRVRDAAQTGSRDRGTAVYAMVVSTLRAALGGRTLSAVQPADVDFGSARDQSYHREEVRGLAASSQGF